MADSKVTLKLLIDKKGQRVLYAESGTDFVDFLFSLLVLPAGTAIKLLGTVGGLANLHKSVKDLNNDYILPSQNKDVLLKPKSSAPFYSPNQVPLLPTEPFLLPSPKNSESRLYTCGRCKSTIRSISSICCPSAGCYGKMSAIDDSYVLRSVPDAKGGFVRELVTYMVMDDLSVSPMSTISNVTMLNKFNIKDLDELEERVVHIGMNEGIFQPKLKMLMLLWKLLINKMDERIGSMG
ncbi:hypothetical protein M8C21_015263, partial [Ambrosia artemisiifolia]